MNCIFCSHNGNKILTSYPPQIRCDITGELHWTTDECNVTFHHLALGHWIWDEVTSVWKCSVCGKGSTLFSAFCPHCGCRMEGEKKNV